MSEKERERLNKRARENKVGEKERGRESERKSTTDIMGERKIRRE